MRICLAAVARVVPLTALMLSAWTLPRAGNSQAHELRQTQAQVAEQQTQIVNLQRRRKRGVASDPMCPIGEQAEKNRKSDHSAA
jgi:hypothetical protein